MYPDTFAHSTRYLSFSQAGNDRIRPSLQTEKTSHILLYIHCPPCDLCDPFQNFSVWLKGSLTESVDVKLMVDGLEIT